MFSTTAASPCSVASHHQITLPGNEGKESRIFQVRPSTSGGVKSLKLTPAMYMTLDGSSVARNNNTNSPHTRASSSQASLHHLDLGGEGIYGDHPLAPGRASSAPALARAVAILKKHTHHGTYGIKRKHTDQSRSRLIIRCTPCCSLLCSPSFPELRSQDEIASNIDGTYRSCACSTSVVESAYSAAVFITNQAG